MEKLKIKKEEEEKKLKKIYVKEKGLLGEPKKEEYRIEIPKKGEFGFKKSKKERFNSELQEEESKNSERDEQYKGKNQKKMYNIKIYNNNYDREDEEDNYESNSRNLRIMHQNSLKSNLSESFLKGERPTKIKIFKCVVWKNLDPNLDEDTIKILKMTF